MFKRKGSSKRIQVKLIDFGLSVFQGQKLIYSKSGTPGYVAPKVLKSKYLQHIRGLS